MDNELVPAHIHFVRWFIRIRWVAVLILIASNYIAKHILQITIQDISIYIFAVILFSLNILHTMVLRSAGKKESGKI